MRRALAILLICLPVAAWAHPQDVAALELIVNGDVVDASLDVSVQLATELAPSVAQDLTAAGIAKSASALQAATLASGALTSDDAPCTWGAPTAALDGLRIQLRAAARCERAPGKLKLTLPFVESTPPTFRLLVKSSVAGHVIESIAGPGREVVSVEGPKQTRHVHLAQLVQLLLLGLALGLGAARRDAMQRGTVVVLAALAGTFIAQAYSLAPTIVDLAGALAVAAAAGEGALEGRTRRLPLAGVAGLAMGLHLGAGWFSPLTPVAALAASFLPLSRSKMRAASIALAAAALATLAL